MENNELKQFVLKIVRVIILIIWLNWKIDLDNILIEEKSHKNILIYDIWYKTLIGSKPLLLNLIK